MARRKRSRWIRFGDRLRARPGGKAPVDGAVPDDRRHVLVSVRLASRGRIVRFRIARWAKELGRRPMFVILFEPCVNLGE